MTTLDEMDEAQFCNWVKMTVTMYGSCSCPTEKVTEKFFDLNELRRYCTNENIVMVQGRKFYMFERK